MSFKHWPILAKSLSLLLLLAIVSILATIFASRNIKEIDQKYSDIIAGPEKASLASARANRGIVAISRDIYRLATATNDDDIRKADAKIAESREIFMKNIDAAVTTDPRHADIYDGFKADLQRALDVSCAAAIKFGHSTDVESISKATTAMTETCEPTLTAVSQKMVKFNDDRAAALDRQSDDTSRQADRIVILTFATVLGGLIIASAAGVWLTLTGLVTPVKLLTGVMTSMSQGHLDVTVPGQDRRDELGAMARAAEIFRNGLHDAESLRQQAQQQKERAENERRAGMLKLADEFEKSVGGIVSMVSSAATEMQAAAAQLTATAQETSTQSATVSAAAEEAGANVTSVASSAEELGASVGEIARQVEASATASATAVQEAENAVRVVSELNTMAASIGDVVDVINGLASQTNLLALNATIESARAGDAGKGFAVVAAEVKQLAGQTAKATTEISEKVAQIQAATARAANTIETITGTIQRLDATSTAIASAVEQQTAATQEIIQAVNQAAIGTSEVVSNIAGVADAAEQTGAAASQVLSSSGELAQQAERLHKEMDSFLATVKDA